jgi:hypothetical protein
VSQGGAHEEDLQGGGSRPEGRVHLPGVREVRVLVVLYFHKLNFFLPDPVPRKHRSKICYTAIFLDCKYPRFYCFFVRKTGSEFESGPGLKTAL